MMTCLNATASTAAASKTPTIMVHDRVLLHEGSIVKIHVPLAARQGEVQDGERTVHFLQWKTGVNGGVINFFVHGATPEELQKHYGDTVTAEAKVWQKNISDERKFVYVDFLPTSTEATHALFSLYGLGQEARESIPYAEADWLTFKTPGPLRGAVVLVPLTAMKLDAPELNTAQALAPKVPMTQLQRYQADGWDIVSETDTEAKLEKNGRTMTYPKPKDKSKKNKKK